MVVGKNRDMEAVHFMEERKQAVRKGSEIKCMLKGMTLGTSFLHLSNFTISQKSAMCQGPNFQKISVLGDMLYPAIRSWKNIFQSLGENRIMW